MASLTCSRLAKSDALFASSQSMRTVVLDKCVCVAVLEMTHGLLHKAMAVWHCGLPEDDKIGSSSKVV